MNKSVLSISLDPNIANQTYADAHTRHIEYAKEFNNYTVLVLNTNNLHFKPQYHWDNLHIYLTNVTWKYWAVPKAIYEAVQLNKKYHFDIITTQDPLATGVVGLLLKFILSIPLNIQFHESYDLDLDLNLELNSSHTSTSSRRSEVTSTSGIFSSWIKFLLSHSNSARVVNPKLHKQIKKLFPKLHTVHIPMMIAVDYFYRKIKPKKEIKTFLSVGRMVPSKNFTLLVDAFSQVVKKYPKTRLIIAGDGVSKKSVQSKIIKKGLEDSIELVGMLSMVQIRTIQGKVDAFALASNHEGWGNVFIETAAAGLPIISTKVGAIGQLLEPKKDVIATEVGNINELANAMIGIINSPIQAQKMAHKAQSKVLKEFNSNKIKFDWINMLKKTR